jgi:hypothetical protein
MNPQTSRSPSYLVRNPYSYCFRMFVPKDLQAYIGRSELRYSLKTGNLGKAKYKARIIAGQVQRVFKFLRKGNTAFMKLSDKQIQEMVQKYFKKLIESYDQPRPPFLTDLSNVPPFVDQSTFETYLGDLDYERRKYRLNRNIGEYSEVEEDVDRLLRENGVDEIDKKSPLYWKLCEGLMGAVIKGIEFHKNRLTGNSSDDASTLRSNCNYNPQNRHQPLSHKQLKTTGMNIHTTGNQEPKLITGLL